MIDTAISLWCRQDLGLKPKGSEQVDEVLLEAGIEVYKRQGWKQPGQVLKLIADKRILIFVF